MEKTTKDIDTWFAASVKEEFDKIPHGVIKSAKGNPEYMCVVTQSIARKLCFREKAVNKVLITLV